MKEFKGYQQQRKVLEQASKVKKQPFLAGGFAEDALLHHGPSREHFDIDWFMMREDIADYTALAKSLGFKTFGTYGANVSGDPVYMSCTVDESLWVDFVIADKDDGRIYIEFGKFLFDDPHVPPLKPIRIYLDTKLFEYPRTEFDGFKVQTISPLALYQMRVGLHVNKTMGELREKDKVSMKALKERFFADNTDEELIPRTELLM